MDISTGGNTTKTQSCLWTEGLESCFRELEVIRESDRQAACRGCAQTPTGRRDPSALPGGPPRRARTLNAGLHTTGQCRPATNRTLLPSCRRLPAQLKLAVSARLPRLPCRPSKAACSAMPRSCRPCTDDLCGSRSHGRAGPQGTGHPHTQAGCGGQPPRAGAWHCFPHLLSMAQCTSPPHVPPSTTHQS